MSRGLVLGRRILVDEHGIRALKDSEGRAWVRDHSPRGQGVLQSTNGVPPGRRQSLEDELKVLGFQRGKSVSNIEGVSDIA